MLLSSVRERKYQLYRSKVLIDSARCFRLTPDTVVIIAGLSNSYSHYVTTFQEYQLQVRDKKLSSYSIIYPT